MKKIITILSALAIIVILIISCNKKIDNIPEGVSESSPTLKSVTDTMYIVNDSDFYVSSVLCDSFNLQYIKIKSGNYKINFDENHPYGYLDIDVELPADAPFIEWWMITIHLKIAKVYTHNCPNCHCCCGIGFRCSFMKYDGEDHSFDDDSDRYKEVTLSLDATTNKLSLTLNEEIQLNTPGWEF